MLYEFKYADLLDDDAFKLVFGQESTKDVMIEFLNRVIEEKTIVDVEFRDKEMFPIYRENKASVFDLFCTTDDGSRIIVELQKRKQESYAERMLYYSMHQILKQVEAGASSFDFCPIYVISIMDFTIEQNEGLEEVRTVYRLLDEKHGRCLSDRLTYIFLELPKMQKTEDELDGDVLEGMYFCLRNMSVLRSRPKALKHNVFDKIFEVSEFLEMDEVTRDKILENMTTERDLKNQFDYARKEGRAEGHAEGHAEGYTEGVKETVGKMLESGVPVEVVAKALELSVEEIHEMLR